MNTNNFQCQKSDRTSIIIALDRTLRPPHVQYGIGNAVSYSKSAVTLELGPFRQENLLVRFEDMKY